MLRLPATEDDIANDFEIQNWGKEMTRARTEGGLGLKVNHALQKNIQLHVIRITRDN